MNAPDGQDPLGWLQTTLGWVRWSDVLSVGAKRHHDERFVLTATTRAQGAVSVGTLLALPDGFASIEDAREGLVDLITRMDGSLHGS